MTVSFVLVLGYGLTNRSTTLKDEPNLFHFISVFLNGLL